MYISKKRTLQDLLAENGNSPEFLQGHGFLICLEVQDSVKYAVHSVGEDDGGYSLPYIASFNELKEAFKYVEAIETTCIDMPTDGLQMIKLGGSDALAIYLNEYEDRLDEMFPGYSFEDEAYKIGEKGISVCLCRRQNDFEQSGSGLNVESDMWDALYAALSLAEHHKDFARSPEAVSQFKELKRRIDVYTGDAEE